MTLRQIGFAALVAGWVTTGSPQGVLAQDIPWTVIAPFCNSTVITKRLPTTAPDEPADVRVTVQICVNNALRNLDIDINGSVNPVLWDKDAVIRCVYKEMDLIFDQEIQKRRAQNLSPTTLVQNILERIQEENERIIDVCLGAS